MDIIQLIPPKHLNFSLPNDTHRTLTITNLTLHTVHVGVIKSHQYEISLSNDWFFLQAFEQKKIEVTINWNQQSRNCSIGKLRIFYYQMEQQASEQYLNRMLVTQKGKYYFEDLAVYVGIDFKALNFMHYQPSEDENVGYEAASNEANKKYYLMTKIKLPGYSQTQEKSLAKNQNLKNQILTYLQSLPEVISIQTCEQTGYLIEFSQKKADTCDFLSFQTNQLLFYYVSRRIVAYGTPQPMIPLVNLYDEQTHAHKQKKVVAPPQQKQIKRLQEIKPSKKVQEVQNAQPEKKQIKKSQSVKQSFAMRRQGDKVKGRRRNKSEQKIIENQFQESGEEQEEDLLRLQIQQMKREALKTKKVQQIHKKQEAKIQEKIVKINETNIEMCQKILSVYIDKKQQGRTQVYVILRDCIRCYVLEEPMAKKVIKFDPIYEQNVNMPCPVDLYKNQLIFGNQTSLFWVNVHTGQSQWKYVQRKYIYALSVIEQLSLVSVGGKNFSKLSYFGKETSRSNIKLYSCSSSDKHEHLFTYDLPGANVGNVMNSAYITVGPLGTKLLLVHTLNAQSIGVFHFLRVKAFNKIQIYGQIDLDQLGILQLVRFKYNPASQQIVCMQTLGQTEMDSFKRLKVKCQYQKVEVFTEGLKVPLKKYHSFQLGGDKQSKDGEWMTIVDETGSLCHIYHFQTGHVETLLLGNGQIKQVYSVSSGRYMLVCAESFMRIRQNLQIKTGS